MNIEESRVVWVISFLAGVAICVFSLSNSRHSGLQLVGLPVGLAVVGFAIYQLRKHRPS